MRFHDGRKGLVRQKEQKLRTHILWEKHKAQRVIGNARSLKSQSPQHKTIPSKPPHSAATTGASIQMIETGGHLTQITPSSIRRSRPIFYSLASIVPISLPTGLTTSLPTFPGRSVS